MSNVTTTTTPLAPQITRTRGYKMRNDLLAIMERIIEQGGDPIIIDGQPLIVNGKVMMKFPDASTLNSIRQTLKDCGYIAGPEDLEPARNSLAAGLPFSEAEDVVPYLPPTDGEGPPKSLMYKEITPSTPDDGKGKDKPLKAPSLSPTPKNRSRSL